MDNITYKIHIWVGRFIPPNDEWRFTFEKWFNGYSYEYAWSAVLENRVRWLRDNKIPFYVEWL